MRSDDDRAHTMQRIKEPSDLRSERGEGESHAVTDPMGTPLRAVVVSPRHPGAEQLGPAGAQLTPDLAADCMTLGQRTARCRVTWTVTRTLPESRRQRLQVTEG